MKYSKLNRMTGEVTSLSEAIALTLTLGLSCMKSHEVTTWGHQDYLIIALHPKVNRNSTTNISRVMIS